MSLNRADGGILDIDVPSMLDLDEEFIDEQCKSLENLQEPQIELWLYDLQITRTKKYFHYTWINYENDNGNGDQNQNIQEDSTIEVSNAMLNDTVNNCKLGLLATNQWISPIIKNSPTWKRTKYFCPVPNCSKFFFSNEFCLSHIFYSHDEDMNKVRIKLFRCFRRKCTFVTNDSSLIVKHIQRKHPHKDFITTVTSKYIVFVVYTIV